MIPILKHKLIRLFKINVIIILCCILTALFSPAYVSASADSSYRSHISVKLTEGWQYLLGESPVDENNLPLWTSITSKGNIWNTYTLGSEFSEYKGEKQVWLRVRLSEKSLQAPGLLVRYTPQAYEIYMESKLLFKSGTEQGMSYTKPMDYFDVIRLPSNYEGRFLYLKFYISSSKDLSSWDGIEAGSYDNFFSKSQKRDIEYIAFGIIFIFIGISAILVYIFYRQKDFKLYAFLGFYSLCSSGFIISGTSIKNLFYNNELVWMYISAMSLYLTPVGINAFAGRYLHNKYAPILTRFSYIYAIHAVTVFSLSITGLTSIYFSYKAFLVLFIVSIAITSIATLKSITEGDPAAKTLTIGGLFASAFGIVDIFNGLTHTLPWDRLLYHWGVFLLIITLILSLGFHLINSHNKLLEYSKELEDKNISLKSMWDEVKKSRDEIAELNNSLEKRVAKRTEELEDANSELSALNEELTALNEQMTATMETLRETQEQLVQSEKMAAMGYLIAGIAHELNTPLASIKSNVQLNSTLLEALDTEDKVAIAAYKESVISMNKITLAALDRLIKTVKGLINFARLDESDYKEADINECIDSAILLLNNQMLNRIEVIRNYTNIPVIACYPKQLNQVFYNIIMNSVQAIRDKGEITIYTECRHNNIYVSIADTGVGISPENISKIFDPGFTTKGVSVGIGLGLSVSYKIIKQHKGSISVESTPGLGTKFTIELPVSLIPFH